MRKSTWSRLRASRILRAVVVGSTTVAAATVVGVSVAGTAPTENRSLAVAAERALAVSRARAKEPSLAPGTYRGEAFDACAAPTSAQMTAWRQSPYRAVVIYFGGVSRGCKQPNLTAGWVSAQRASGWRLIPMYVGPQAPCTKSSTVHRITAKGAATEGRAAATDAVARARQLGLARDSVLIYDMESYAGDAACEKAVLTFLGAWTAALHDQGYLSGVYGDTSSTVRHVVAATRTPGFVAPDHVDFARWDNVATLTDVAIPADVWPGQRRMKQYRGPHKETWGGVTINVDSNVVDMAPLPETRAGDFTGNGWSDLLTVDASGALDLHTGNGVTLTRRRIATGWDGMDAVTRLGDFTGDGRDDLIAREKATGHLWLHPGTGTGVGPRIQLGRGWGGLREITAAGDMTRDGRPDLLAVEAATGRLLLFPGKGTSLGAGTPLGTADWSGMEELTGVGDADGDGVGDLIARETATGTIRFYAGWGRTMEAFREVLAGGAALRGLTGAGDFDRDGTPDLLAVDGATGRLSRYAVRPGALGAPVRIAEGLSGVSLV